MIIDYKILVNRDPSNTTTLRTIFAREMVRRFKQLVALLKTSIVSEDVFGLRENTTSNEIIASQELFTPGRRAFAFLRDSRKVAEFMDWLNKQIEAGILDVSDFTQVGESVESAWQNKYVETAYKKGVTRARKQLRDAGLDVPTIAESGGIGAVLTLPVHVDRLGLIYTRTFNELKGITDSMAQLVSRILSTGLVEGQSPSVLARTLVHAITGSGQTLGLPISYVTPQGTLVSYVMPAQQRATILARTEIIRAHSLGQLQEFENWRVEGVQVQAEFQTAGDDRVCLECSSMEGNVYSIEEARSIIPVHPQCRCIWLPVV